MYGKSIEKLRKEKGLTINELCHDIMTRSAYYRFSLGDSDTSTVKFVRLLERLAVSPEEFFILDKATQEKSFNDYLNEVNHLASKNRQHDLYGLRQTIIETYHSYGKKHLLAFIQLKLNLLMSEPLSETHSQLLISYLMNVETWTRYEIILFGNCMFLFSSELIHLLLKKSSVTLKRYANLRPYGSEPFRLIANALLVFLERKNYRYYFEWIKELEQLSLADYHYFEKTFELFLNECQKILKKQPHDKQMVKKIFSYLESVSAFQSLELLESVYETVNE